MIYDEREMATTSREVKSSASDSAISVGELGLDFSVEELGLDFMQIIAQMQSIGFLNFTILHAMQNGKTKGKIHLSKDR